MKPNTDSKRHAQRHAFSLASKLVPKLKKQGISEDALWESVKSEYGVDSRSDIDERGWVLLTARFDAANQHKALFEALCQKIIKR